MSKFKDFNFDEKLLKAIVELGYQEPTPVQAQAIPKVFSGSDLICSAQTGTGKTAAFMLPALQKLLSSPRQKTNTPRILVLAPTRELAMQITSVTEKYTKHLPQIKTVCIYGGVPYLVQNKALSRPYDILVATPGRLLDHMQQRRIDLSDLEFLVLDEADRMLDMGFINDVETIAENTPENRQTLLFSATLEKKILRLSKQLQNSPEEVLLQSEKRENLDIEQRLYYVDGMGHKMRLLDNILENTEMKQAIIFISTRNAADTLAEELQDKGYITDALHGNMSQRQRTRTIGKLRKGNIDILVATDVAARGIDVLTVSHVINIDLPFQAEDYIHRIGRTGRAGGKGVAITFAAYREEQDISKINQLMSSPMTPHTIEGLEPGPKSKGNFNSSKPKGRSRFGRKNDRDFSKPRREFRGEKNKDTGFSSDKSKRKKTEFDLTSDKSRSFKKPFNKKNDAEFSSDKPRSFKKSFNKKNDAEFSSDKPRSFKKSFNKKNDAEFSSDKPRSFKKNFDKKKDTEFSSDKPRDFKGNSSKKKSFSFSGKKKGFSGNTSSRGKSFGQNKKAYSMSK